MNFSNFDELAERFGEVSAYGVLEQIERASGISPNSMTGLDPEMRLANAIRTQNAKAIKSSLRSFKKMATNKTPKADNSFILFAA